MRNTTNCQVSSFGGFAARLENDLKKIIALLLPQKLQTDTVRSGASFILPSKG